MTPSQIRLPSPEAARYRPSGVKQSALTAVANSRATRRGPSSAARPPAHFQTWTCPSLWPVTTCSGCPGRIATQVIFACTDRIRERDCGQRRALRGAPRGPRAVRGDSPPVTRYRPSLEKARASDGVLQPFLRDPVRQAAGLRLPHADERAPWRRRTRRRLAVRPPRPPRVRTGCRSSTV